MHQRLLVGLLVYSLSAITVAEETVLSCKVQCEDMKRSPGMCKVAADAGEKDEFLLTIRPDGYTDADGHTWHVSDTEIQFGWRKAEGGREGIVATKKVTISRISGSYSEVSGYAFADKSGGEGYTRKGECTKFESNTKKF
jgi:hypothetical protein